MQRLDLRLCLLIAAACIAPIALGLVLGYGSTALGIAALPALAAVMLAVWFAARLSNRIDEMTRTLIGAAGGERGRQVTERGPQELEDLAAAANVLLRAHDATLAGVQAEVDTRTLALDRTNRELLQALREAQAASQARDDFIANISHEIRTPMTAIVGFADMLLDDGDKGRAPPRRLEGISSIRRNADLLLGTINDLLDMSTLSSGRVAVRREATDLIGILGQVQELSAACAAGKGLALEFDVSAPLPVSIHTDGARLRQILLKLVENAIKFTRIGSVTVRARLVRQGLDESLLSVEVADTGPGLNEQQISQLFKPFGQVDTSLTRAHGGLGMGLAIAQRLARALGGDITVQSCPGRGSCFTVTVATGPVEAQSLAVRELPHCTLEQSTPNSDQTGASAALLPFRILLVEDGLDNQRLIRFHLSRAGADVTVAENGQVGVQQTMEARGRGEDFDLVLMDMQMPIMDGYAATAELRARGWTGPVIALTAHAMAGDREKCLGAGCSDYLTKPIEVGRLLATCRRWMTAATGPKKAAN